MSALTEHLERHQEFLRSYPGVPNWKAVLIIEAADITYGIIDKIPRKALRTVASYEPKFEAMLGAGYSWINLSAIAVVSDELIVSIELPREAVGVPVGRTSVNHSGPRLNPTTGAPEWNASTRMILID
jgi:hypothetical protein